MRANDSLKPTTRRQAKEQLCLGESDSFLTPPRLQLQLDLAASQTLLENVIDDDESEELVSLEEEANQQVIRVEQLALAAPKVQLTLAAPKEQEDHVSPSAVPCSRNSGVLPNSEFFRK